MNDSSNQLDSSNPSRLSIAQQLDIDQVCARFDHAWHASAPAPLLADYLEQLDHDLHPHAFLELLRIDREYRNLQGLPKSARDYEFEYPQFSKEIALVFSDNFSSETKASTQEAPTDAASQAAQLVALIQQYQHENELDVTVDPDVWSAQFPNLAAPLRKALHGLDDLRRATMATHTNSPRQLGDYVIIREIGRGGMGAVFEAEQKSLVRRVALKVLWFSTVSDATAVQRFQREAETVARLHHTHIVPIYSVGSDGAINFFAMQLIDGSGLDQVIRSHPNGFDIESVVIWGIQAADALSHAHQRGVIHRDVKPSNLLLDKDGQIWLTDFGLAKRSDDVTLSMVGALLGTPRYMSPEQASASTRDVDHRSDIYSLGATLYELLTGRPVHDAATPHGVISQILTAEIVAPRKLRAEIPKDLDTVLMKALDKNPANRYATTEQLASDLRAVQESRPIQARRASPVEQFQKWFSRHRRNSLRIAASIVGTLFFICLCWLGISLYRQLHASTLLVDSTQGNLVAELYPRNSTDLAETFAVPMQTPAVLQGGEYRLRVAADGYLSQDANLFLPSQTNQRFSVNLVDQLATDQIQSEIDVAFVSGIGQTVRVAYNDNRLQLSLVTGSSVELPWSTIQDSQTPGFLWPLQKTAFNSKVDKFEIRPWIPSEGEDLNSDQQLDIVIAFRHQALVAAFNNSGMLWIAARGQDLQQTGGLQSTTARGVRSSVVQEPRWIADQDGDGVRDLLVSFADVRTANVNINESDLANGSRRWIELLSGANGKSIWNYDFPSELFVRPANTPLPDYAKWFVGNNGSGSSSGSSFYSDMRITRRKLSSSLQPYGQHIETPYFFLSPESPSKQIIVTTCANMQAISFATGKPLSAPVSTGVVTDQQPVLCELGVNHQLSLLLSSSKQTPNTAANKKIITAWAIEQQNNLWTRTVDAAASMRRSSHESPPAIATAVDLDNDGITEIILPCETSNSQNYSRYPWGSLEVLNGMDGSSRWSARIYNCDSAADRYLVGPDINNDQHHDLFVASLWGDCDQLVVECRSGKDGTLLWIVPQELPISKAASDVYVVQPILWKSGADGWPQIVVTLRSDNSTNRRLSTWTFSSKDGHNTHRAAGFDEARIADVNGDRIDDLCLVENLFHSQLQASSGIRMLAFQGTVSEPFQQIGVDGALAATDFDNDGLQDSLILSSNLLQATSSATGKTLWRTFGISYSNQAQVITWESTGADSSERMLWDFNQDGVLDLIFNPGKTSGQSEPCLISGKSGGVLAKIQFSNQSQQGIPRFELHDLDHDGIAEIVCYGFSDWEIDRNGGYNTSQGRLCLSLFSLKNQSFVWRIPLSVEYGTTTNPNFPYQIPSEGHLSFLVNDQNRDGHDDIIVMAESDQTESLSDSLTLRCCSGINGLTLWERAVQSASQIPDRAFVSAPTMALYPHMSGSSAADLLLLEIVDTKNVSTPIANVNTARVALLRCISPAGKVKWQRDFPVPATFGDYVDSRKFQPTPLVIQNNKSEHRIALNLPKEEPNTFQIVILQPDGSDAAKFDSEQDLFTPLHSLFKCDQDQDGNDELLFWGMQQDSHHLFLLSPWENARQLNTFASLNDGRQTDVILSNSPNRLILADRARRRATAFDMQSAKVVWQCLGSRSIEYNADIPSTQVLLSATTFDPHVLFNTDRLAICRTANVDGAFTVAANIEPVKSTIIQDPRLVRHLERVDQHALMSDQGIAIEYSGYGLRALLIIVLPLWQIWSMLRTKKWSIGSMLLLMFLLSISIACLISPRLDFNSNRNIYSSPILALQMAIIASPVVVFVAWLLTNAYHRNSRSLFIWTGFILLATAIMILADIGLASLSSSWEPGETISFEGSQLLLLDGFVVVGYLFILWSLVYKLYQTVARRR